MDEDRDVGARPRRPGERAEDRLRLPNQRIALEIVACELKNPRAHLVLAAPGALRRVAQLLGFSLSFLQPGAAVSAGSVLNALGTERSGALLVTGAALLK